LRTSHTFVDISEYEFGLESRKCIKMLSLQCLLNIKVPSYWPKQSKAEKAVVAVQQDQSKKNKINIPGGNGIATKCQEAYTKDAIEANGQKRSSIVQSQATSQPKLIVVSQQQQDNFNNNGPHAVEKDADEGKQKMASPTHALSRLSISQPTRHSCNTLNLSETLKYIGCYVYLRCRNIDGLKPSIVVGWVRGTDRSLVVSGWQEMGFVSQPNMIVLYMLLRECIPMKVRNIHSLKALIMSALYMCYAYNGHEISYPLKPFLTDGDRGGFWDRCMDIIGQHSDKLLRINMDAKYYNDIQVELRTFGRSLERRDR